MTQQTGIRRELEAAPVGAAGASLRQAIDWRSIKWKPANRNVRRLQRRIVQAQQQGKKRKVRALQFILTRSYSARCLAVRRVVENSGRRTPGVDGQILDTPEKKAQAVEKLSAEDYKAQPLKRVYIAKKNGKGRRPLGIPTLDATPPSQQNPPVVLREVLNTGRRQTLCLGGNDAGSPRQASNDPVSQSEGRANQTSRQDQSRSQSLRSKLGELL
jgi:hypothetical protein